jgi:DNA (cytosine-5)-methyltransferase 1
LAISRNKRKSSYEGKDEGLRYILDGITQINRDTGTNYKVEWKMINTAEHGVPQIRERVFMVGSRDGQDFRFPEPGFASPDALKDDLFTKMASHSHGMGCARRFTGA